MSIDTRQEDLGGEDFRPFPGLKSNPDGEKIESHCVFGEHSAEARQHIWVIQRRSPTLCPPAFPLLGDRYTACHCVCPFPWAAGHPEQYVRVSGPVWEGLTGEECEPVTQAHGGLRGLSSRSGRALRRS